MKTKLLLLLTCLIASGCLEGIDFENTTSHFEVYTNPGDSWEVSLRHTGDSESIDCHNKTFGYDAFTLSMDESTRDDYFRTFTATIEPEHYLHDGGESTINEYCCASTFDSGNELRFGAGVVIVTDGDVDALEDVDLVPVCGE